MKKKDITTLLVIAGVSALFAYIGANAILSSPSKHTLKVEVVNKIDGSFPEPKSAEFVTFFNDKALNPTQQISIGDDPNTKPLSNGKR